MEKCLVSPVLLDLDNDILPNVKTWKLTLFLPTSTIAGSKYLELISRVEVDQGAHYNTFDECSSQKYLVSC